MEEKEEKRKIRIISQIDDHLAIQGQAYIRGDLKEALSLAYEIIDIAKQENLNSFIKEQEQLIAKIKGLIEQRNERKREKLRAEQLSLRNKRLQELRKKIKLLEEELTITLEAEDLQKSIKIYDKAKTIISKFKDNKTKRKWDDFNSKISKLKIQRKLMEKAEEVILEVSELKEKNQFKDLKDKLTLLINQFNENGIVTYLEEIKKIQMDILNAEKDYTKKIQKIDKLTEEIELHQKGKEFDIAITKCEDLIDIAKSVNRNETVDEFSKILINLQDNLKVQELQDFIKKLNEEGLDLLKKGEIISSLEKFKVIHNSLKYYIE